MMRGIASPLEKHHRVQILDEAIEAAVRLSHRYIPARQLPDKSVSLLDTAAARVAVSQHAVPPAVDDCRRRIQALETELRDHRPRTAADRHRRHRARRPPPANALADGESTPRPAWKTRWATEKAHGRPACSACAPRCATAPRRRRRASRNRRTAPPCSPNCAHCRPSLTAHQGENPLILPSVDEQAVAAVVGDWTGIPVGRMVKNEVAGGAGACRHARQTGHRPGPWVGDDRQARANLARRTG